MIERTLLHTITEADVGRSHIPKACPCCGHRQPIVISGLMGRVLPIDIGKRIYDVGGVLQVENNEQRDKRLAKADS